MRDFTARTRNALARKGIRILGTIVIAAVDSEFPFACGDRGYRVDDNGCGRIWTFAQVMAAAS